ncbi:hypothetical protein PPERSA_12969 [Pseudocohnilembus persalinus]|uniref:Palmitoyltransferase n=1 Tax=Pseudocohnilembus persalinus TaxID=266149 RepID=A0A0V0R2T1_PSEPJ|nr:hypothetical protein PPERSA_12969 [Pseudocohnilembus persalinus]|eukprot:KRX08488.1 hypothetical protein PPERSA_12969 [Pseudocohnilembus persalinus]
MDHHCHWAIIAIFFGFHVYLVLKNRTTIGDMIDPKHKNNPDYLQYKEQQKNIYNQGKFWNFIFYFGKNPLLWLIPVGKPLGNGYQWSKNEKIEKINIQQVKQIQNQKFRINEEEINSIQQTEEGILLQTETEMTDIENQPLNKKNKEQIQNTNQITSATKSYKIQDSDIDQL